MRKEDSFMSIGNFGSRPSLWKKSLVIVALTIAPILLAYGGSQGSAPQATPAPAAQPNATAPQPPSTPPPQEAQPHPQGEQHRGPGLKIPDTFTNLKVLPPYIKKPDLV